MDEVTRKFGFRGKNYLSRAALLLIGAGAVYAAATFLPNNQPVGYVAPPALSGTNFSKGDVVAYTPWFENGSYRGDLLALPVNTSGVVILLAPDWLASGMLDQQDYLNGRRIVTTDGSGNGTPFRFDELTDAQKVMIGSEAILNFVRGDRSGENSTGFRVRSGVLGDIIHSTPVYVGKPVAGLTSSGYLAFAAANANRSPMVYVGANDGMLHAFNASDGSEAYAYIPSMVVGNLGKLMAQPYKHQYFVDGLLTVEDAQFGGVWHSALVGGLGAGGKGYFALDVTSPSAASESAAAGKILWEFHGGSTGAENLGYSYSRPSIVRMASGQWAAVVGNGYLSTTGAASLYIIGIQTGSVLREIVVPDANANGLSSPTLLDTDSDGMADTAYAGDLNGNLWKFDLSAGSSAGWGVAYGGQPLFRTAVTSDGRQAITTSPEVGRHPNGGVFIYVATGRLFAAVDGTNKDTQAVYGIWDKNWPSADVPISIASLVQQNLKSTTHASGESVRVATDNPVDWESHRGWMTPTEILGASTLDKGERVLQDLLLRDGRISAMLVNPTIGTGDNWFVQLDGLTGGAPRKTIIDVNKDFELNVGDNVDGDGDGEISDSRLDRVVGQYQSFGLASRPVIGQLTAGSDAALINHLIAIPPNVVSNPDDPGLLGGHFDLDTSSMVYPFSSGTTDSHVHEWDDKYDSTTINYFDIIGNDGLAEINHALKGVDPDEIFMLTVANDNLSPGGVLEINSTSISVTDYRKLLNRYLSLTLLPGETFPLYKLNPPTAGEAADGVVQLRTFKLSFDAFAIISGDLIPTETGCVRKNEPGGLGEYRNGALMLQALNASNVAGGFVFDVATQRYVAGSTAVKAGLGYATAGLFWESTVFWHWTGPCYGTAEWAPIYQSCVIDGGGECLSGSAEEKDKGKKKKKGKKDEDETPPDSGGDGSPAPGVETDPAHSVTNTTVGGDNDVGRLFWRELVPEE